jgi:L-rhamnose mutarotase
MKRIAMTVMLKDDPQVICEYEKYHADPWPQVVERVRKLGIERVYIYRFGRRLFMFMEVPDDFDLERDLSKHMEDPKVGEWDELMRSFMQTVPGAPEGSTWVQMKEVHALEHP